MDVKQLARQTLSQFEQRERTGGERYWKRVADADDWIREMCFAAHDDHIIGMMMPDDHRYQMIVDALRLVESQGDHALGYCSEMVPVYRYELYDWLASRVDRKCYVDEAAENYGPSNDIEAMLSNGYLCELDIVTTSVLESLWKRLDLINGDESEEATEEACHE